MVKVILASDHAGIELRKECASALTARGVEFTDAGPQTPDSVDYPDFAARVARAVAKGEYAFGVLVGGTGIGMSIVANKVKGVRAALCTTEFEARMARNHNDANVLCLGQRVVGAGVGRAVLEAFLDARFEAGRHEKRVQKIRDIETAER